MVSATPSRYLYDVCPAWICAQWRRVRVLTSVCVCTNHYDDLFIYVWKKSRVADIHSNLFGRRRRRSRGSWLMREQTIWHITHHNTHRLTGTHTPNTKNKTSNKNSARDTRVFRSNARSIYYCALEFMYRVARRICCECIACSWRAAGVSIMFGMLYAKCVCVCVFTNCLYGARYVNANGKWTAENPSIQTQSIISS